MKTLKDIGLKINDDFPQIEYDKHGNEIHFKNSDGYERWTEYGEKGKEIHFKNSNGLEWWREYDEEGKEIHYKNSNGEEWWLLKEGKLELIDGTYYLDGVQRIVADQ